MKKVLISTVAAVLFTAGSVFAMECAPAEVPVKTKVEMIDVNGNIVIRWICTRVHVTSMPTVVPEPMFSNERSRMTVP